jgi:hypothetical protein
MTWRGAVFAVVLIGCSSSQVPVRSAREVVMACPLTFDGLVPGSSRESNVVALYGKGSYDADGGDTGARTYSGGRQRIVRFVFGVDYVLDRIVIEKADGPQDASAAAVPLDDVRFWRRLLPGVAADEIDRFLGKPQSGDVGGMIYRPDDGACSSGGFVSFEMNHGTVQRIIIAADDDG